MKIVVLCSYAESLRQARAPLLREMASLGHTLLAVAGEESTRVRDALASWGIGHEVVPMRRAGMNPLGDLRYFLRIRRLLADVRPDLTLAYHIKPVVYGSPAAARAGVRSRFALITGLGYAFIPGDLKQRAAHLVASILYRRALPAHHHVFFQNTDDHQLFQSRGLLAATTPSSVVNGSGVDLAGFPERPLPPAPLRFLFIGRLLKDKGIREFVAAAKSLRSSGCNARFQILGRLDPNPASIRPDELAEWTRTAGIEYLGETADVRPFLAECSVFVLPSYREGTPMTTLEAMATGRAIITTDVPGCRQTVASGVNGFVVPAKDVRALADAMRRFVAEPALAVTMGFASRRIAGERYDVRLVNHAMLTTMGLKHPET